MRCTEEIDEKVVRESLVRLLKKRHEEFEKMKDAAERKTQKVTEQRKPKSRKRTRKPRRGSILAHHALAFQGAMYERDISFVSMATFNYVPIRVTDTSKISISLC